jgi:hypothetical protein
MRGDEGSNSFTKSNIPEVYLGRKTRKWTLYPLHLLRTYCAYIFFIYFQTDSMAINPQANYTDRETAAAGEASADFCE